MRISFQRIGDHLFPLPEHHKDGDAGLDLRTVTPLHLLKDHLSVAKTGWACAIPDGFCGLVCPRSGLARRYGLRIVNSPGIIDSGYRGEMQVLLVSDVDVEFNPGDRIAQLLVMPVERVQTVQVEELSFSDRGIEGFGHTGVA